MLNFVVTMHEGTCVQNVQMILYCIISFGHEWQWCAFKKRISCTNNQSHRALLRTSHHVAPLKEGTCHFIMLIISMQSAWPRIRDHYHVVVNWGGNSFTTMEHINNRDVIFNGMHCTLWTSKSLQIVGKWYRWLAWRARCHIIGEHVLSWALVS